MSVIIRYACDGCGAFGKDKTGFKEVIERYYTSGDYAFGERSMNKLYCNKCFNERENPRGNYAADADLDESKRLYLEEA